MVHVTAVKNPDPAQQYHITVGNFDGIGDKVIYLINFPLIKGMYECLVILNEEVDEIYSRVHR
jgi:hypothetical protein